MTKRIGRRFGENINSGQDSLDSTNTSGQSNMSDQGNNSDQSGSDKEILLRLKDMAQELLNLQTTIAVRQKSGEGAQSSDQQTSVQEPSFDNSTMGDVAQPPNQPTKEGRLIRRPSMKISQAQPEPSIEQKIQQLSQLRYELSNELEVSLQNLQKVMRKSQAIVSEMNEILKNQGGGGK